MRKHVEKIARFLSSVPSMLFALTLIAVLIVLFMSNSFSFAYKTLSQTSYITASLFAFVLFSLLLLWCKYGSKKEVKWYVIVGYFAIVLIAQFVIAKSIWYYPGWDVESCYATAEAIARGEIFDQSYFQSCPNNAPITLLLSIPLAIAIKLGLAVPYAVLPYCGAIVQNLSCYIAVLCVQRALKNGTITYITMLLSSLWIAFSGYMTIPYTDVYGLLFAILAIYLWLLNFRPFVKWLLIGLVCMFGASIKPSIIIILVAMVILGVLKLIKDASTGEKVFKKALTISLALFIGIVPGNIWKNASTAYVAGSATPQNQLSETHYIMMGQNPHSYGGHSPDDVAFTMSFDTLLEKREANISVALERIRDRSFAENINFYSIKLLKAYAEGNFAFTNSMLILEEPKRDDNLSHALRSVYRTKGENFNVAMLFYQVIWLMILFACLLACIIKRKQPFVQLLSLCLFGLTFYLMLVEVWPRYLYVFSLLYLVLAMFGLDSLSQRFVTTSQRMNSQANS